jgi:Tol biopolymer transport system component
MLAWAGDSKRVAFAVAGTATTDSIRVVTMGVPSAVSIPFAKAGPTSRTRVQQWTPSGEMEVVQSVSGGNDFFLLNPATHAARRICEGRGMSGGDGCRDLSPDGRWIVARKNLSEGGRSFLRNIADGSERPLTTEAVLETIVGFSPDSRLFAFRSNRDGSWGVYVVPVDDIPVDQPTRIASLDAEGIATASWTPSGVVLRVDYAQINQYRIDIDPRTQRPTGAPVRLTQDSPVNTAAFPSPDGRRIAYISRGSRGRPAGFAVMDANGSRERVVKEVATLDLLLRMEMIGWVSADEIAYADAGLGTTPVRRVARTINILNVTTGVSRQLPSAVTGFGLHIVGETLFYFDPEKEQLHARPVAGGSGRLATTLPDDWWNQEFSRDGRLLAFSTVQQGSSPGRSVWPGELRLRSLETGADSVLARFENSNEGNHAPLDLSTDGRFLVYRDADLRHRVMNIETRESWPLLTTPPAGVSFDYAPARWSPDGSYVVVEGYTSRTTWRAHDGVTYDAVRRLTGGGR